MKLPDDPETLLERWSPTATDPWDRPKAAHLLRRTGFGATPEQVDQAMRNGVTSAVDAILSPPAPGADHQALRGLAGSIVNFREVDRVAAWWLQVMIDTPDPLREMMALTWHGHFAVSAAKVDSTRILYQQYCIFHEHGLGDLRELASRVISDAAMLRFLDADKNRAGHPNENLARELMELFLLGIGNYTEKDVQEAARALTGMRVRRGRAEMVRRYHDDDKKKVLGSSGKFDPDALVDLCFEQDAAAHHLARRLTNAFVHPDPPPRLLGALAGRLRDLDFDATKFLRWLLETRLFYHPGSYRCLVKSPVQYGVGAIRMLGARVDGNALHRVFEAMGQRLFYPPGVQGWVGGDAWVSSGRLVARNRFAASLASRDGGISARYPLEKLSETHGDAIVEHLLDRFLAGDVPAPVRAALGGSRNDPEALVHLILTLPEFQLA